MNELEVIESMQHDSTYAVYCVHNT